MGDPYFDAVMVNRQVLSWALATRLPPDRWEPLVAENARNLIEGIDSAGSLIWQAQFEHHFCLVAASHLLTSLALGRAPVAVDPRLRAEIRQGRDLHEHWKENMPVFNVTPRRREPKHPTGQQFAAANPDRSPYFWLRWDNEVGPKLMPNVPSTNVRTLVDGAESHVLRVAPEMATFLLPRPESSWIDSPSHGWWPRPRS
jgi:hypothetical protein